MNKTVLEIYKQAMFTFDFKKCTLIEKTFNVPKELKNNLMAQLIMGNELEELRKLMSGTRLIRTPVLSTKKKTK